MVDGTYCSLLELTDEKVSHMVFGKHDISICAIL